MQVLKQKRRRHNGTTCFGKAYARDSIEGALAKHSRRIQAVDTGDCIEAAAGALADGSIAAWFRGGSEFGPRALGHRSILADPRRSDIRNIINTTIKLREDFRPFAPSVLAEEAPTYFECDFESPYMILVAPVRPEWRDVMPAVVHLDGSARIQTVTMESDPEYYKLLRRFKTVAGIGVLLNTSLNKRGMPIVETPEEALGFFLASPLDLLVMDGYVVRKKAVAETHWSLTNLFSEEIRGHLERNPAAAARLGGVYQVRVIGVRAWTIDLSTLRPLVVEGAGERAPDVSIELDEANMQRLISDPSNQGPILLHEAKVKVEGSRAMLGNIIRILELR
jgi:carbamoyltransferase